MGVAARLRGYMAGGCSCYIERGAQQVGVAARLRGGGARLVGVAARLRGVHGRWEYLLD